MSLLTKDSLVSLREMVRKQNNHRKPPCYDHLTGNGDDKISSSSSPSSCNKHHLPMQDLQERVIAKRRRLVEQQQQQQQQQEHDKQDRAAALRSSSSTASSSTPKKTVSFDSTKNTVHHRCLDEQDLDNSWLSNDDFERIQGSIRDTVTTYRHCLQLHRGSNNNNMSVGGADAINACLATICMRGLEHRATDNLTLDKIRRIRQYRVLLLSQQRLSMQQWGCVDSNYLADLSRNLSTQDAREAAEVGHLDAQEAIAGLKVASALHEKAYNWGMTTPIMKSQLSSSLTTQVQNYSPFIIPSRPNARTTNILNTQSLDNIVPHVE